VNTLVLLALAVGVGVLIGAVGIGGILLAPILTFVGGWDVHLAIGTSVWSFLFTGLAATVLYARHGSIDWRLVRWLVLGIVPASVLGALTNALLSSTLLTGIVAMACVVTGVVALARPPRLERPVDSLRPPALVGMGALVGFASALSGAGGAAVLMPILLVLRIPALAAIGASQAIQVPVAGFATLGYAPGGQVDFLLGGALGLAEVAGVVLGTRVAHTASPKRLRRLTAYAVVVAGAIIMARLALFFFGP
jgi:uncharacterized membrane protein YfcA